MGKDCKSCEKGEIGHSESFCATLVGIIRKIMNRVKLAILSHSELLLWGKIGKVVNWAKLAICSNSEPLHGKRLEKLQIGHSESF